MEKLDWDPGLMLEVRLNDPDDFLKVRETLSRIGVASRKERKLYQSYQRGITKDKGRYKMTINSKKIDGEHIIRLLDISNRDKSALLNILPYDVEILSLIHNSEPTRPLYI